MRTPFTALLLLAVAASSLPSGRGASTRAEGRSLQERCGYFELRGQTRGEAAVAIELPSSQLDDVLKSLTVIDLGDGGQVSGVSYTTLAPLDRRLDEIALDAEQASLFNDQACLRENLGKLGDSSEETGLRRRYVFRARAPGGSSRRDPNGEGEARRRRAEATGRARHAGEGDRPGAELLSPLRSDVFASLPGSRRSLSSGP